MARKSKVAEITKEDIDQLGDNVLSDIKKSFENMIFSMKTIEAEKENIKEIIGRLNTQHGINKTVTRKALDFILADEEKANKIINTHKMMEALVERIESKNSTENVTKYKRDDIV